MAFNAAQTISFFLNGPQMGLSTAARDRLVLEGLMTVENFEEFMEEELKMAVKNIKQPIPGDADADPPVAPIAAVYL